MSEAKPTQPPLFGRLEAITVLAILGVLSAALGVVAWALPASRHATDNVSFRQAGVFSYSAKAPATSAYGTAGLTTGAPILTNLVGPVRAGFSYRLSTDGDTELRGTADLTAVVALSQGLSKTFSIVSQKSFSGNVVSVAGTLPLRTINAYVDAMRAALRDTTDPFGVTVTIAPHVSVVGTVVGQPFKQTFSPELPFRLDGATTLTPTPTGPGQVGLSSALYKPAQTGVVRHRVSEPRPVSLLVAHPSRHTAMEIGFGLALLCLLLGLRLARPLFGSPDRVGESERIRALYGSQLTPVRSVHLPNGPVAEVASIAALADLAKRYEATIMHLVEDDVDVYVVWDNGMLYRYSAGEIRSTADAAAEQPVTHDRLVVLPVVMPKREERIDEALHAFE